MKLNIINATCIFLYFVLTILSFSCRKEFLDKKPNSNLLLPKTLDDFQKLLENESVCNRTGALPQISADEYFIPSLNSYQLVVENTAKNAAVWLKDIYQGEANISDWNIPYQGVFYANAVIDGLKSKTDLSNDARYNNILGWAYFVRAYDFFNLTKNFAPIYDSVTSSTDLGIPIKLSPNVDEIAQRSSVKASYDQILSDIQIAAALLDPNVPINNRNRPSKVAAYALFSRVYLSMRKYDKALLYSDSCLNIYNTLINYNTVSLTSTTPFSFNANEVLFSSTLIYAYTNLLGIGTSARSARVDTNLIKTFAPNDLRFSIFFSKNSDGFYNVKRGYISTGLYQFTGLATDEMFLIKAECLARKGDVDNAMISLNTLLSNRYKEGLFVPLTASSQSDALNKILLERRKELVWRSLRWDDLKRLNKEGSNIILARTVGTNTYSIAPNSSMYVFPIPDDEIALSGIQQNSR